MVITAATSGTIATYQWAPTAIFERVDQKSAKTTALSNNIVANYEATAVDGCTATASALSKIGNSFFMPTSFTPNGDGLNDFYRIPPRIIIQQAQLTIYDRWENVVFRSDDVTRAGMVTIKGFHRRELSTFSL